MITEILSKIDAGMAVAVTDDDMTEIEKVRTDIRTAYNRDSTGPKWIAYVSPHREDEKEMVPPNYQRTDLHVRAHAGRCLLV